MALLFLKIKRSLIFFLLRRILKKIKPSRRLSRNRNLLGFSKDMDERVRKLGDDLNKAWEGIMLFAVNFEGALESSNVYLNRLSAEVRNKPRSAADEYMILDLTQKEDEDNKRP